MHCTDAVNHYGEGARYDGHPSERVDDRNRTHAVAQHHHASGEAPQSIQGNHATGSRHDEPYTTLQRDGWRLPLPTEIAGAVDPTSCLSTHKNVATKRGCGLLLDSGARENGERIEDRADHLGALTAQAHTSRWRRTGTPDSSATSSAAVSASSASHTSP
jgi:hypothetical protein